MLFRLGIILGLTGMLAAIYAGPSEGAERGQGTFPSLALPASKLAGTRAVNALGDKLPKVAQFYGLNAVQLRSKLLR